MAYTPEEFRKRPREFDPALADLIVERVLNGEGLAEICSDRDYPMAGTFLQWVNRDPDLAQAYTEALKIRADLHVEQMLNVADDYNTQRARNMMDARKFAAEKILPGKYGPRAYTTVTTTEEKDVAGIDYGADVRRKLEAMAERLASKPSQAPATSN